MHLGAAVFLVLSAASLFASAAPFLPRNFDLQHDRRRAVDYLHDAVPSIKRHKRAGGYSVVQVDGGSSSTTTPPAPTLSIATVMETVTQASSAPAPETRTLLMTSTITGSQSQQTTLVTQMQEVATTVTEDLAVPSITSAASSSPSSTIAPVTSTVVDVITSVAPAPHPTTNYYDDGLWHTYYPIKTFVPPSYFSSGGVITSYTTTSSPSSAPTASWSSYLQPANNLTIPDAS